MERDHPSMLGRRMEATDCGQEALRFPQKIRVGNGGDHSEPTVTFKAQRPKHPKEESPDLEEESEMFPN